MGSSPYVSGYFESATFSFRIRLPSTRIRRIRRRKRIFFNPFSRVEKKKNIRKESDVWTVNPDIFESDDVAKSCLVFYRTINQLGGTSCRPSFLRMNRDTSGCVSTGIWFEFLNPERKSCGLKNIRIRVDGAWDDNPVLSYCLKKPGRLLEKGVSQIIPC